MKSMQKESVWLSPVEMTKAIMEDLESRKLIIRIAPGRHDLYVPEGETQCATLYEPLDGFGPHKIMAVTVNRMSLIEFGTHPDNEDFYLIGGGTNVKTLYLVIALCLQHELEEKISTGTLSPDDFIALTVKYNDPEVSFFTMLKNVPHGEAIGKGFGKPASFYVTESRDMTDVTIDMDRYELVVRE